MLQSGTKEDMNRRLRDALEAVTDEQSFIQFLVALGSDWEAEQEIESVQPSSPYSSGALGWENGTIAAFLDASCRWGSESANGLRFYQVPENTWRRVADIIFAGKGYE
jgi:hypothetical protein